MNKNIYKIIYKYKNINRNIQYDIFIFLGNTDKDIISYEFVTALTECSRNCYLYSLEKFTSKFTTYESHEIENSQLVEETSYSGSEIQRQQHDLFNIISNKQIMLYVDKYFSNVSNPSKSRMFNWLFGTTPSPLPSVEEMSSGSPSNIYDKSGSDIEKYLLKYRFVTAFLK